MLGSTCKVLVPLNQYVSILFLDVRNIQLLGICVSGVARKDLSLLGSPQSPELLLTQHDLRLLFIDFLALLRSDFVLLRPLSRHLYLLR